ncbi:hypothetical protein DHD80_07530 [Gramella sp. AN32]|nr:hypothetical protein [Gramella sp. AN32]
MLTHSLAIIILVTTFFSCKKDSENPFLINAGQVGAISKNIRINQLDSIFSQDSLVRKTNGNSEFRSTEEIKVFEKDGTPLLTIAPLEEFDSTSTVGYIRVLDPRYETKKGLNINSTFKDVVENYSISRIENTINAAVVFLDEINAYITIDKAKLPANLRYDTDSTIMQSQIPDDATFKYFMIYWN